MPEFLTPDLELFISKVREATFNTPLLTGADYLRVTTQNPNIFIPEMQKSDDAGRAGNASEFATAQCNEYWLPPAFPIADRANFDWAGRLWMRTMGGAPAAPVNLVGAAWKHQAGMLPKSAGLQYPGTSVISFLGGASYLTPGCVVDSARMFQDGAEPVQVQFNLLGTGKHKSPHPVGTAQVETATAAGTVSTSGNAQVIVTAAGMPGSPRTILVAVLIGDTPAQWAQKVRDALTADPIINAFFVVSGATDQIVLTARYIAPNDSTMNISLNNGTSAGITPAPTSANTTPGAVTLPGAPAFACLDSQSFLEYTDDVGLQDLTVGCRVRNWSVEVANNHQLTDDRCIGDPKQIENDFAITTGPGLAKYIQKTSRGSRTITASMTLLLDSILPQQIKMARNILLTNVTFGARGAVLDAGGPTFESLKVIIPKGWFSVITGVDSNGKAAITLNFKASFDATDIGARVEVVNNISSGFN